MPDDTLGSQASLLRRAAVAPALSPPPVVPAGTVIAGAFRIERLLGRGGMGLVYLARDLRLRRDVAIKLHAAGDDRLLAEARATARLTHPNIVTVYEVGTFEERVFLAMEYLAAGTLRSWLDAHPRRWDETLARFLEAARGLAAAHQAGMVHRDFKPENVLLGDDGVARVADFGLAVVPAADDGDVAIATGTAAGTPAYMSPEQRRGDRIDARSDQYSFCLALRGALADGRAPRTVRAAIARGIDDDPARRWPSMAELGNRLVRARRTRRVVAGVVVAGIATAGVAATAWWVRGDPIGACRAEADRLLGVWDANGRANVRAALASCPACRADGVIQALDRYTTAWSGAHQDACVAEQVNGDGRSARRIACLDQAHAKLAATIALLSQPDASVARFAPSAVAELPAVSRCADAAALAGTAPLPIDPDRVAEARSIAQDLGRVGALWSLGKRDDALPLAVVIAGRARTLGSAALTGEVLHALGLIQSALGDPAAEATREEAVRAALAGGHDEYAVRALAALAYFLGQHGRADEGLRASLTAEAIIERLGGDDELARTVLAERATILAELGRADDALDATRRSMQLARRVGGSEGMAMMNLGGIQLRVGAARDARQTLASARPLLEHELGTEHPSTLWVISNLGLADFQLGDDKAAITSLRHVVEIEARLYPGLDRRRAPAMNNLASAMRRTGDHPAALVLLDQVLVINEQTGSRDLGEVLGNIAIVNAEVGRLDRAYELAGRSLTELERTRPADSDDLINARLILGTLARYLGHDDEAARLHEAVLPHAERALPADDPTLANARVELALSWMATGKTAQAVTLLDAAVEVYARTGVAPGNLAEARFALARALWDSGGDRVRARTLADEAKVGYLALGAKGPADEIAAWRSRHR